MSPRMGMGSRDYNVKDDPNTEYNIKDNLKKAFKYALKQKKEFVFYFIANIIICILGAISPLLSAKQLLKISDGLLNELLIISGCILVIELTHNLCNYLARKYSQLFSREILKNIQIDMSRELLHIQTRDLDKKSSGIFIDRLVKDTSRIGDIFLQLNMSFTDLVTNIGILVAVFITSKILFVYYAISIVIIFLLEKVRIQKFNEMDKKYRKSSEATTGLAGELVRGIRDIKVLNASPSFMNKMEKEITSINEERYNMSQVSRKYSLIVGSVRDFIDFFLIVISVLLINNKYLTISSFVVIYMYRSRIFNLLTLFSAFMESFKDFNLSAGRVFEIIDSKVFDKEKFGTRHIDKIKGNFEFKNVRFGYEENQEILKGLSFKIKSRETVSFVGKSGAGKTTIFSLLAKMYDINSGSILIDGININELDEDSIRGNISIITQNPYIFNLTIRENFSLIKSDLTEEEMIEACKTAELHDYIMSLPKQYDTLVGEGGLTLSGGQRQRLAIARALVQKTKIILFDEATSALDNETQKSIQDAINNMKNDYTILIIAHRLSTVINSDRILMLDNGVIEDEGTHEDLLKRNKEYRRLYELEMEKDDK